jgi:hypothetical protein
VKKEKINKQAKLIARNNGYNTSNIMSSYNVWKDNEIISSEIDKKWVKFTYFGEGIIILTKLFKNTTLKVACSVDNTIKTHCNVYRELDKYSNSGVYKLKCLSCDQVYIGQIQLKNGRFLDKGANIYVKNITEL